MVLSPPAPSSGQGCAKQEVAWVFYSADWCLAGTDSGLGVWLSKTSVLVAGDDFAPADVTVGRSGDETAFRSGAERQMATS